MFKRNKFLLLSGFAHLIVLYIVAQSVMFPSASDLPAKKPDVIQARLVFDFPPPTPEIPVEIMEQEKSQPVESEEDLVVVETPAETKVEPVAEPEPEPEPEVQPKREEAIPEEPEQNEKANEVPPREQANLASPSPDISAPATSMARRHLNSFQQQQQNKVAEQASRYYQQHKNSPVIDDEVKNPFMTEDEKMRDSLKVRADCSSASKKTTAVILGFLGGQIDCSTPPSIDHFIQDRINKQSNLPRHPNQDDQKRPQSIVIKKKP